MTLAPALARLERGFRRMWRWATQPFRKTRGYRFEGEQANHAQQLAETQAAIAGFEAVTSNPDASPEERHWLHKHRVGMEERLAVFEGKPRLTVEELHERDAIETHLYGAPLPRGATGAGTRVRGLIGAAPAALGLLGGVRPWMLWSGALAAVALWGGYNDVRAGRLENQRDDARRELGQARESLEASLALTERLQRDINAANRDAASTAETIEAERARRLRAEAEARRIRNEIERARAGANTVDYGFGSVRDAGPEGSSGAGSGNPTGDRPR